MRPGDVIAGRYRVERELGRGGMGRVFEATHLTLKTDVALKLLRAEDEVASARLVREARAIAQLRSPHICKVLDVGADDDDVPFMALELLSGEDLARKLRREGALPQEVAADYILQACEALAEAHALGIIHRDIKPSNLFLARDGTDGSIKVLDFGVSKIDASSIGVLTGDDSMLGTPRYMAPEQWRSAREATERSDIWSLGVTLYELISGRCPFQGDNVAEIYVQVREHQPPALEDRAIFAIVRRCIAKDPAKRFSSVAELAAALAPLVPDGRESAARTATALALPDVPTIEPSGMDPDRSGDTATEVRPRRRWLPFAALASVFVVVGTVVSLRAPHDSEKGIEPTPSITAIPVPEPRTSESTTSITVSTPDPPVGTIAPTIGIKRPAVATPRAVASPSTAPSSSTPIESRAHDEFTRERR